MNLLKMFLAIANSRISYQSSMFSWEHIDVNLLNFGLFIEVGNDCFRTEPNRFVGMDITANYLGLNFHFIVSFSLMSNRLSMTFLHSPLLLMIP